MAPVKVAYRSQSRSGSRIWFPVTDRRQVTDHSRFRVAGHGGDLSLLAGAIVTSFGGASKRSGCVAGVVWLVGGRAGGGWRYAAQDMLRAWPLVTVCVCACACVIRGVGDVEGLVLGHRVLVGRLQTHTHTEPPARRGRGC